MNAALIAPGAPTPSTVTLDADQQLSVTGTISMTGTSPYSWQWLISINGGSYADATQCGGAESGSGATSGALENCTIPGGTLTADTTYNFELSVTDSASTPETATSLSSAAVTTSSVLTAGTPTPTSSVLDNGQSVTLTANPSGGAADYTYQWYSGSSSSACTALGSPITNAMSSTYLASPTSTTYYCYNVTDAANATATSPADEVTVSSALTAPTTPSVSAAALDADQALTATGTLPTTGTSDYSWQWLVSVNGGVYVKAIQCTSSNGTGAKGGDTETCSVAANTLTVGDTYAFELEVTDNATVPETATSASSPTVTVSSALTAPAAPTASATKLDVNQALTVTGKTPTSGSPTYSWQWLVSINGAAYADASQCAVNGGTGATVGATETCSIAANTLTVGDTYSFELMVVDSADSQETATSLASSSVSVSSILAIAGAPLRECNGIGRGPVADGHREAAVDRHPYLLLAVAGLCQWGSLYRRHPVRREQRHGGLGRCHGDVHDLGEHADGRHLQLRTQGDGRCLGGGSAGVIGLYDSDGELGAHRSGLAHGERNGIGRGPVADGHREAAVDRHPYLLLAVAGLCQWGSLCRRHPVRREQRHGCLGRCHGDVHDLGEHADGGHLQLRTQGDGPCLDGGDAGVVDLYDGDGELGAHRTGLAYAERDGARCGPGFDGHRNDPDERNSNVQLAVAGLGKWRGLRVDHPMHREQRD